MNDTYQDPATVALCQGCAGDGCMECQGSGFFIVDDGVLHIPWIGWQDDTGLTHKQVTCALIDQAMEADDKIASPFTLEGRAAAL